MSFQAAGSSRRRSIWKLATLALVAVGLLALAGCGSSSNSSSSAESTPAATTPTTATTSSTPAPAGGTGAGGKVTLAADPGGQLKYDKTSLTAKAGDVTIDFSNSSSVPHNVTIESSSGVMVGSTPTFQGGAKTLTTKLKPGTYKFFCSVPGHRQAGMEGTLTVN